MWTGGEGGLGVIWAHRIRHPNAVPILLWSHSHISDHSRFPLFSWFIAQSMPIFVHPCPPDYAASPDSGEWMRPTSHLNSRLCPWPRGTVLIFDLVLRRKLVFSLAFPSAFSPFLITTLFFYPPPLPSLLPSKNYHHHHRLTLLLSPH